MGRDATDFELEMKVLKSWREKSEDSSDILDMLVNVAVKLNDPKCTLEASNRGWTAAEPEKLRRRDDRVRRKEVPVDMSASPAVTLSEAENTHLNEEHASSPCTLPSVKL